ncbi:MAG: PD-(D/E)XK nuclease family protein [Spirochaetales bacterium]|nr:MAG: PD-(D/E)XK nuclease family protein [Spirochaetales bacterium]
MSRSLGLGEIDFEVDPDSARDIGTHYHDVLERLFRKIADTGLPYDETRTDEYLADAVEISDTLSGSTAGMIPDSVSRALRPLYNRVLESVIHQDAGLINGHTPELVEGWERRMENELGVVLAGRVDRVTRDAAGTLTLVDYKKNRIPSAKGISGDAPDLAGIEVTEDAGAVDALAGIDSIQIPFYVLLIESSGERVSRAFYYSLEGPGSRTVFDESGDQPRPAMTRERLDEIIGLVERLVRDIVARARRGDYRCNPDCDGCAFRGVCRSKFVVR